MHKKVKLEKYGYDTAFDDTLEGAFVSAIEDALEGRSEGALKSAFEIYIKM